MKFLFNMSQETKLKDKLWKEKSISVDRDQLRVFMFEFKKEEGMGLSKLFKYCIDNLEEFYNFMVDRTDIPLFKPRINSGKKQKGYNEKHRS